VSETVTAVTDHATDTATLTATQTVVVTERNGVVAAAVIATAIEVDDTGAQRQRIAALDTAPLPARAKQPSKPPQTSEISAKAGGEIAERPASSAAAAVDAAQPSILIADLASVHAAVSAVAAAQATAAPTTNAATASRDADVAHVRTDATAFTDDEEAFFRAGSTSAVPLQPAEETFEDLDDGYQPVGFWDRVLGKRRTPIATASTKKPKK
jgi:hypothetical protein